MRVWMTVLACSWLAAGCNHAQLRRSTLAQARTIADLQTQQVLDNLALFCANPEAVPSFAVPAGGVVNVLDTANAGFFLEYTRVMFDRWGFNAGGLRSVSGNWSMAPINDPDKLKLIRCLYQHVVGYTPAHDCDHCQEWLRAFFGEEYATSAAPRGWFCCGCKKDVPADACHVGRCGDTYVWVPPEGQAGLARLTLSVLDVATSIFLMPPVPTKELTTYEYRGDLLIRTEKRVVPEVRGKPVDVKGLKEEPAAPEPARPRERFNYFDPYRGLFFVPRN